VVLQTATWSQNLILNGSDLAGSCRPLLERALNAFHACHESAGSVRGPLRAVLVTAAAGRLPGLVPALERVAAEFAQSPSESGDPGEDLIDETPLSVRVLAPDAVAGAVLSLTALLQKQSLAPGHLEEAPLPDAVSPAGGQARFQFRGREYLMRTAAFFLGRDPRCDLVFDTAEYPSVSGHHCKIAYERQGFTLYDLSTYGTLVNDRPVVQQRELHPGDWIRLGPGGPLLRFLGHAIDSRKLMPTA
jgi:hypothetical protein